MVQRRVYDDEKHIHFITFSCYKRRRYLQTDLAKRIVIGHLGSRRGGTDEDAASQVPGEKWVALAVALGRQ